MAGEQQERQKEAEEEAELDATHVIWERKRFYCCFGWQRPAIHSGWKSDAGRRLKERHLHPSTKEYRKAMAGDARAMQDWEWRILVNEHTDPEGWQYARCVWLNLGKFRLGGRSQERLLDCVRRRQWVHQEYAEHVLSQAKRGTVSLLNPVELAQQAREEQARYEEGVKAVKDLLAQLQHSKRIKSMAYALLDPVAVRAVSNQHVKALKRLQSQALEELHEAKIAAEEVWGEVPRIMQPALQLRHVLRSGVNHLVHDVKQGMHDIRHGVGQLLQLPVLRFPGRSGRLESQPQQQRPSAVRRVLQLAVSGSSNTSPNSSISGQVLPTPFSDHDKVDNTAATDVAAEAAKVPHLVSMRASTDATLAAAKVASLEVGKAALVVDADGQLSGALALEAAGNKQQAAKGRLSTLQENASAHWQADSPFQGTEAGDAPSYPAQQVLVPVVTDVPGQAASSLMPAIRGRVTRRAASIDEARSALPAAAAFNAIAALDTQTAAQTVISTTIPATQQPVIIPVAAIAGSRAPAISRGFSLPHPMMNRPSDPKSVTAADDHHGDVAQSRALPSLSTEQPALIGRLVNLLTPKADGVLRGVRRQPWASQLPTQHEVQSPTQVEPRSGSATMQQSRNWLHWPARGLHWPGQGLFSKDAMRDTSKPHRMVLSMPELECAAGHALAIYGDFEQYLSNYPLQTYYAAIAKFTGVPEADVLLAVWRSSAFKPAHYVALDREHHKIIVSVRGTFDRFDTITDLVARPTMHDFGVPGMLGLVHSGILQAARATLDSIKDVLQQSIAKHPDYDILITGHSMGGGTAALMAMLLRHDTTWPAQQRQHLRAIVLAPAAILSKNLAWACQSYVASIVYNWDMVPRVDINSVARYLAQVASSSPLRRAMLSIYHAISHWGKGTSSQAAAGAAAAGATHTTLDTSAAVGDTIAVQAETLAMMAGNGTAATEAATEAATDLSLQVETAGSATSMPTMQVDPSLNSAQTSDRISDQDKDAEPHPGLLNTCRTSQQAGSRVEMTTECAAQGDMHHLVLEGSNAMQHSQPAGGSWQDSQPMQGHQEQQGEQGEQQQQAGLLVEQEQLPSTSACPQQPTVPLPAVSMPAQHDQDSSAAAVRMPSRSPVPLPVVSQEAAHAVASVINDSRSAVRSISTLGLKASFRARLGRYRSNSLRADAKLDDGVRAAVEAVQAIKSQASQANNNDGIPQGQAQGRPGIEQPEQQRAAPDTEVPEQEVALQRALVALQDLLSPVHGNTVTGEVPVTADFSAAAPELSKERYLQPAQHIQHTQHEQHAQQAADEATKLVTSALGQLRQLRMQQSCRWAASMRVRPGWQQRQHTAPGHATQQEQSQQEQQENEQQQEAWLQEQITTRLDAALAVMQNAISSTALQSSAHSQAGSKAVSSIAKPLPASPFELHATAAKQPLPAGPVDSNTTGNDAHSIPAPIPDDDTRLASAKEASLTPPPPGDTGEHTARDSAGRDRVGSATSDGKLDAHGSKVSSKASCSAASSPDKIESKDKDSIDNKLLLQPLQAPGTMFWLVRDTRLKHQRVPLVGGSVLEGLKRAISSGKAPAPDAMPAAQPASPKEQASFMAGLAPGLEATEEEADTPVPDGGKKGAQELPLVLLEADATWFTDMLVSFKAMNDHTPVSYHKALTQLIKQHKQKHRWPLRVPGPRGSADLPDT